MRRSQPTWANDVDQRKRREDSIPGITKMEMHAVSEHLDDHPPVPSSDLADELGKGSRDMSRRLIARLLGQPGVARKIGEDRRLHLPSWFGTHARLLECSVDMLEQMLHCEGLGVPSIEPCQRSKRLFNRVVEVVDSDTEQRAARRIEPGRL